ncbi:hypothetical protein DXT99_10270 [Pontibacter diazotrophicus]|uniref:DUF5034 domain-containing protein n=1 Tax=Pontibacter diazotrophicus TaxID=1400979 RepID=A0A3D8LDE4_9BACT|nr:hypothetical protein [Pontibacter diazotrophicus]RDV15428.1 hypothetical protein DXT99_10270 [Pontibacter diazotrophicus]
MNHSKIVLTLVFLLGITLVNCGKEESCPTFKGYFFDIQGISSVVHHYQHSPTVAPPLEDNAKLAFNDYHGLTLRYSVNYLSSLQEPARRNGFGQVYALSCFSSGEGGSKLEKYENITVVTLNDFNAQYKKGDTINEIMTVGFNESIRDFITSRDTVEIETQSMNFKLNEPPSLNSKFKVKVIIELSTGEIYSKESTTVEFK